MFFNLLIVGILILLYKSTIWSLHTIDDEPLINSNFKCNCPRIYFPVCASNNKSYTNECRMRCADSRFKFNLKIKRYGRCLQGERRSLDYDYDSFEDDETYNSTYTNLTSYRNDNTLPLTT